MEERKSEELESQTEVNLVEKSAFFKSNDHRNGWGESR